jgi:hypothetical protein
MSNPVVNTTSKIEHINSLVEQIETIRLDIKSAIESKGISIPSTTPFSQYGDIIRTLQNDA